MRVTCRDGGIYLIQIGQEEGQEVIIMRKVLPDQITLVLFKKFLIGLQLIYNAGLVSGVQQSESVTHIHISILLQILFPYRPLQSIKQHSLFYTLGPYQLSFIHSSVYMSIPISQFTTPLLYTLMTMFFNREEIDEVMQGNGERVELRWK